MPRRPLTVSRISSRSTPAFRPPRHRSSIAIRRCGWRPCRSRASIGRWRRPGSRLLVGSELSAARRLPAQPRLLRVLRLAFVGQLHLDARPHRQELSRPADCGAREAEVEQAPRQVEYRRRACLHEDRRTVRTSVRLRVGVEADCRDRGLEGSGSAEVGGQHGAVCRLDLEGDGAVLQEPARRQPRRRAREYRLRDVSHARLHRSDEGRAAARIHRRERQALLREGQELRHEERTGRDRLPVAVPDRRSAHEPGDGAPAVPRMARRHSCRR